MKTIERVEIQTRYDAVGFQGRHLWPAMTTRLLVLFTLFLTAFSAYSQTIPEYGAVKHALITEELSGANQAAHLDSLIFGDTPRIYLRNSVEKVYGSQSPVCLETDVASVGKLAEGKPYYKSVELITIRLNGPEDLNFLFDPGTLTAFARLKYVHLLCSFGCDTAQLSTLFPETRSGVVVFYSISVPN
jgi:hypothetical protein